MLRSLGRVRRHLSATTAAAAARTLSLSRLDYANALVAGLSKKPHKQASGCPEQRCPSCNPHLSKISHYTCPSGVTLATCSTTCTCFSQSYVSGLQAHSSTAPVHLSDLVQRRQHTQSLRSSTDGSLFTVPRTEEQYGDWAFSVWAPRHWNSLPSAVQNSTDYKTFRKTMKTYLFRHHFFQRYLWTPVYHASLKC